MNIRTIGIGMVLAAMISSCGQQTNNATEKKSKQEVKAVSEYLDSSRWGKAMAKDVEVDDFDAFKSEGNIEVVFKQTDVCVVKTVGHEKSLALYEVDVKEVNGNRQLEVKLKDGVEEKYDNIPTITLLLGAPILKEVVVANGDVELKGSLIQNEDLAMYIRDEGDVIIKDIEVGSLKMVIDGKGDVTIKKAKCDGDLDMLINDEGDIEGKVRCKDAKLQTNGSGTIDLNLKCKELTAICNGRGDIELKGECAVIKKKESAFGSVDSRKMIADNVILLEK